MCVLAYACGLQCVFSVNNNTVHHDAYLLSKFTAGTQHMGAKLG